MTPNVAPAVRARHRAVTRSTSALIAFVAAVVFVPGGAARAGTPVPGAAGCPMFPADNVWNADISSLPVDPHSGAWMASMDASSTNLHPDFGPSGDPSNPYGMPFTVVPPGHPFVSVAFDYADESDPGPYPFGPDTPIEGGSSSTGDRHAIMLDPATCTLYELYDATYSSSGSTAGSGAIWNLRSDALRPSTWTSADAAGLPILPGLLRYDEVTAGSVTHAIRMTAAVTDKSFIWPARHQAGARSDPSLPPMGARFRLSTGYDISGYSPQAQVVLRAMQHYGLILADNGSNWYFGGTADSSWPIALVDELKRVPASAFEAVDESSLMVSSDSGQVRTLAPPPPAPPAPPPGPVARAPAAPPAPTTTAAAAPITTAEPTTTMSNRPALLRRSQATIGVPARTRAIAGGGAGWWAPASVGAGLLALGAVVGATRVRRRRSSAALGSDP